MQDEVEPVASFCPRRTKSSPHQVRLKQITGVTTPGKVTSTSMPLDAPDLTGAHPSSERCAELPCEPGVGARALPLPRHLRMQAIEQSGPAGSCANLDFLRNQSGPLEDGQMLADGVVIELHEVGEFADPYRPIGIGDEAKESMARRIAKCMGFRLGDVASRT